MIPKEHCKAVCKLGSGAACCKYLLFCMGGFECGKVDAKCKAGIDAKADKMTAKGDNCAGYGKQIRDTADPKEDTGNWTYSTSA